MTSRDVADTLLQQLLPACSMLSYSRHGGVARRQRQLKTETH